MGGAVAGAGIAVAPYPFVIPAKAGIQSQASCTCGWQRPTPAA
jgi:hypothetical protein